MNGMMRIACVSTVLIAVTGLGAPLMAQEAGAATEREIMEWFERDSASTRANNKANPSSVAEFLFASNGALLERSGAGATREFDWVDVNPKYVSVVPLVDGQAAVAFYYAEGRLKFKGGPAINDYRTRASRTFVKRDGEWRCVTEHYSPLMGGSGVTAGSRVNSDGPGAGSGGD